MRKKIDYEKCFLDLFFHVEKEDFKGIDPSSIKFNNKILKINNKIKKIKLRIIKKIILYLFAQFIIFFNPLINRGLKLQKIYFTKGLALISASLANYDYNLFKNKIDSIIDIIIALKLKNSFVWSHNVDYFFNDETKITTQTPNLITTYFVGNAFFEIYLKSKDSKYLNYFNKTVNSMLNTFPYDNYTDDSICFMYVPNSNYHVHNANILFSEILTKYLYLNKPENSEMIIDLITKSLRYTLNDINTNNSFPYAGPPTINKSVDNYHLGYVVRGLNNIIKYGNNYLQSLNLNEYIIKGLNLYFNNFVGKYIYKTKKNIFLSTLESHSLAEAFLIITEFSDFFDDNKKKIFKNAIENTFIKLWDRNELYFYNNIKIVLGIKIYDKTDMIRWSDSWMLYAISRYINKKN